MENCRGYNGLGLNVENTLEPRMRASVEAVVTWNLITVMKGMILEHPNNLLRTFGE